MRSFTNFCGLRMLTLCLVAVAAAGCQSERGEPKYKASGAVLLDGEPLAEGDINFDGTADGQGIDSGKIKDGKYEVMVKTGTKLVRITATREVPGAENAGVPGTPVYEDFIPEKFNAKTGLNADVAPGENVFDFELTSE